MKKNQTKEQYKEWLIAAAEKNRNNPNHSEQAFIDILDYFEIKYTFQKPVLYDGKDGYIFDFYIIIDNNEFNIEIDGKSHMDEITELKDFKRDVQTKDRKIKVIRLDSYFVLYLRNIFKDKFTKESFLEWIINGCPINLEKDMSEYKYEYEYIKEKYEYIKAKVNTVAEEARAVARPYTLALAFFKASDFKVATEQFEATTKQFRQMIQTINELKRNDERQLAAENIMKDILAKQKEMRFKGANNSTSTSSNNSSTVETSNKQEDEELPF